MNERIKKLADEALKECDANGERGIDQYTDRLTKLLIEKFAYDLMDTHAASPARVAYAATFYGVELCIQSS
jgi:hypothetical protein